MKKTAARPRSKHEGARASHTNSRTRRSTAATSRARRDSKIARSQGSARRAALHGQEAALTLPAASSLPLAVAGNGRELLIARPSGDLTDIVALPRDGSDGSRIVVTLPGQPLKIDTGSDGSIYSDVLRISAELLASAPRSTRPDRLPLPDLPNSRAWAPRPLPLPDGRILVPTRATGRARVIEVMPDRAIAPFIDSTEEAGLPMTLLGREHVALFLDQRLAIVSSADGRIVRRLDGLPGGIESIAGTPDGQTLFFVADGAVWAVAAAGGAPRRIAAAHNVALDRDGRGLLVTRQEASGVRLVRVPLDGGREQEIPVRGDIRIATPDLFSDAVGPDGRILIRIGTRDLGVGPIGLLDTRTGHIERLWPEISADMFGAWTSDGRVAALAVFTFSDLWRFTTTTDTGLQ